MSVKIRLRRVGAKKQPSYRVVIADSRSPRDGRFIDVVGFYNPRTKPTTIRFDEEKTRKWLGNGARPTESVASLLYRAGIVDMRSARYREGGRNAGNAEAPTATAAPAAVEATAAPTAPAAEAAITEATAPATAVEEASSAVEEAPVEPEAAESAAGEAETTPDA